MPRNPQPPMLAPIRARIVDAMLGAAVVLAAPATLLSVLASASAGLPMVTWASGLAYVWLVAVRFAPRIGSRTKAVSLVVVMHLVGAILLYGLGPVGPGLMWLMAASVTAAALLQAKAARLAFMAHLGSIAGATLVFMLLPTDSYTFPHSGLGWFASAAGSLLLGGTLAVAVSTLVSDLERMIVGLSAERLHLKQETARRARLEADLERRVADRTAELAAAIAELERKNLAVERADKVKSEFLSTMSHELRTPLNSVIGFSDLLLEMDDEALPTRQRHFVQAIGKAGRHQLALITDILDLSKIEAGHLRLTPGVLGVEAMLTGASDAIAPQAGRKGVTVTTTTDPELCVTADAARLHQVLLNVLSNAVKFSPEGSAVEVSAVADGPMVRFEVADVGPGVPPELWSRLFQPFEQAESAQNRRNEGTGLGLAISRRLIKAQGGEIEAQDRAGGGLVVRFTLPRADAGSAEPIPAHQDNPPRAAGHASGDRPLCKPVDGGELVRLVSSARR